MNDDEKTREQLVGELSAARRRMADLEAREPKGLELRARTEPEFQFRKLAEKAIVGIYHVKDYRFSYVNPKLAEIFGYTVSEMEDRLGPQDVVHPDDWPEVEKNLRKRIAGEVDAMQFQFRGVKKDGQVIHLEVYGSRSEDDEQPAVIGTLIDISERIQARTEREKELRTFRVLYELALAMTADGGLDENLALIVEKSKILLEADKACLALHDDVSGELNMHTLSGFVTEEFKALRIPLGVGMGGMVAKTGQLLVVQDYFREIGPAFHDVARAEGLISGIAVPVQTGRTNVGVLYVFNIEKTPFSQSDVDTLSLLGNMAAVEITRKQAIENLKESEDQYRRLFDDSRKREELYVSLLNSSADAIVIYDMEGRAQYVSPSFTRIFGWPLEEVYGRRIDFVPDSELDASLEKIRTTIQEGAPLSGFETKRYTRDGRILDISISASRYHDLDGNPAGLLTILRDITDRKAAEEALRQSEEKYRVLYAESETRRARYRTLLDVSPDPIIVYDMQGIPTFTNPAFSRVFGWTFDELAGRKTDFVPQDNWPETQIMIDKVMRGERFSGQETRRYTKDGRVIDVSISGAPFFGDEGKPTGSVVHLRDITSRKVAQAMMAANLRKFQALYDLALALTTEHSLDENLTLIVEKSRDLLSADKAFLALRDEQADVLCMHTLSGIVTDEFKELRIPIGTGLGGRVAQTGQLYVVENYLQEIGPAFHDVAAKEGLVSGIAVPVKTGQTNVGVLYVFNKTKTPFSQADLDTLSMLGNLAAVEITRQRFQEKLRESEENFRKLYEEAKRREELYISLLNSSADAVVIYDMEGRAQYVSPSFTKIFGWTMDEVEGRRIPYLPEEEAEQTMEIIMNLIRDGTPCSGFETRRFTKDGRIVDISISSSRYRDHEGNPAGILATLRDISDRKRSEIALRESEERFRTLAEVAPFGIVVMGPDEKTQYINPTFSELFGYTIADLPDAPSWFVQAYPKDSSRIKAEAIWREEKEGLKRRYGFGAGASPRIFKIRCKDGRSRIVSFRAVVLADGRTIATFLDVTSEVEAQQEVIRAKNEWERTFNSVSDLIMILNGRNEIVRVNQAMADRFGLAADRLIGMSCHELTSSAKVPPAICSDPPSLADGNEHSAEVFDERSGGVFDLRVSPMRDEDGNPSGSVHVARDISAFKSLERARRLAVHHLSHELRTPVAVIKGSVKDLGDETLPRGVKDRKLKRIGRSLVRLSEIQRIVQEIVSPRPYQPTRFPVAQHLKDLLQHIQSESSHRSVIVKTLVEPIETDIIDKRLFEDVVNTLVKNAIENTPDQGTVIVELKGAPDGVLLQVKDQGVGIHWTDREFVFDAFHHTQDTEKYATRSPFDFDAGGKGLELMRLKMLSQEGAFDISFESQRCRHISEPHKRCPGRIDLCPWVAGPEECSQSGGTIFSVLFKKPRV